MVVFALVAACSMALAPSRRVNAPRRHSSTATDRCPSCAIPLSAKNRRRHMAFCCPDLLDPEGWAASDREVVLAAIASQGWARAAALRLRFGAPPGKPPPTAAQVAARFGWSAARTRDTISQFLHAIPPPAEHVPIEIVYEDESLVAVNKPAGLPCTPPHRLRGGSALSRLRAHLGPAHTEVPHPVHRLDLNTSGVLVFAKTAAAATNLMRAFEAHETRKTYAALCSTTGDRLVAATTSGGAAAVEVDAPICRVEGVEHCERRCCEPGETGGQSARTWLRLAAVATTGADGAAAAAAPNGACLVLAAPEHGRTHQVRLHCAAAGAPLLADPLYNRRFSDADAASDAPTPLPITRHALHALALSLPHPTTRATLELLAPMPDDMTAAARALRLRCVLPLGDGDDGGGGDGGGGDGDGGDGGGDGVAAHVHAALATLPAERHVSSLESVHGVGPVTAAKLRAAGVGTVAGLAALSPAEVEQVATAQRVPMATLRKVVVNARTTAGLE